MISGICQCFACFLAYSQSRTLCYVTDARWSKSPTEKSLASTLLLQATGCAANNGHSTAPIERVTVSLIIIRQSEPIFQKLISVYRFISQAHQRSSKSNKVIAIGYALILNVSKNPGITLAAR
ncbi:hypothetical protein BJ138DRAFT_947876 [Hygrophoropsis aurantiaca]|uniref:Uncharacterized protein n=1 Tax=Hygrophoropsis aurantiaca TaxID=72124 RepID=A0ACB8AEE1_9AGAM|nr:hypothetical protein BJ138DRAFT_947876 [Hygrophoropsis aurantiaca]